MAQECITNEQCLINITGMKFQRHNGDRVEFAAGLPDNSIDFTIYSPPFSNLFVSQRQSERDMGNASDDEEFLEHYSSCCANFARPRPGNSAVHCPTCR